MWDYPAKIGGGWSVFAGMMSLSYWAYDLIKYDMYSSPNYYHLALCLVPIGTGGALLAYHTLKNGEEDTATKKKIILYGMAVAAPLVALLILDFLGRL